MRIAHLSRALGPSDGGISLVVEDLLAAQRRLWPSTAGHDSDALSWFTPPARLGNELGRFQPHLVHVHGLWSIPNRLLARRRSLSGVIAPHGMLDPWALAQSRQLKRLAWHVFEQGNLRRARAIQALTPAEASAIRAQGVTGPMALIPNGVNLPPQGSSRSPDLPESPWAAGLAEGERVLLFLSRFHPKKGIDTLLGAWQAVEPEAAQQGWNLMLVGFGDDGALARQVAAAQSRDELQRVRVLAPCFGAKKEAVLSAASAFVLPSHSEGLPMAALEAMAHGLPCLLSSACNLPEAFAAGAALPAEPDPLALAGALRQLFALSPEERAAMGASGRKLVEARFSWPQVAAQTIELYSWILGGGQRPGFVEC